MCKKLLVLALLVLAVAVGNQASAQVFPTVELTSFDPMSGTYVYTLTCPSNSTYPFGYLQIDTLVANAAPTGPWDILGPFVGGVDKLWPKSWRTWDPTGLDAAVWDPYSRGTVINANTYWQGEFVLVVPESVPVPGKAATKDGQVGSYKVHDLLVPGPKPAPPSDTTPPVTTIELDGTLGSNDWYISLVTVTLSATDDVDDPGSLITEYNLNGAVDWFPYDLPFDLEDDGVVNLLARSEDLSGNLEDPPASASLKIDKTAPVVTGSISGTPNGNGWYNSDVTINYTAVDETSGLDDPSQADPQVEINFSHTISTEGANISDTGTATDKAGNVGAASFGGLKIDKTAPVITIISAPTGQCHVINYESATIQFTVTDNVSGVSGLPTAIINVTPTDGWAEPSTHILSATLVSGSTYEVTFVPDIPGIYSVTLSASDLAGNTGFSSTSVTFGTGGFTVEWLPPISTMDIYYMQDGSTVPVKFQLLDPCNNNAYVSTYEFRVSVVNDDTGEVMVPPTVPSYDPPGNHYQINVKTKLADGQDWPLGSYTVIISGPGVWDTVSGPYKSKYGLLLVDKAVAKGSGKK